MTLLFKIAICFFLSMSPALCSCGPVANTKAGAAAPPSVEDTDLPDNTLGPEDVFDVRVYGEEELSKSFRVGSDGSFDYPLLGTVVVVGMNQTEVAAALKQGLIDGGYLKNPQVSVFFRENRARKISVLGEVKKEGVYPYEEGMSVIEAVSVAGGFTPMAKENETTVTRVVNGKKKLFHIPVKSIRENRSQDFILQPGDKIFVPARVF